MCELRRLIIRMARQSRDGCSIVAVQRTSEAALEELARMQDELDSAKAEIERLKAVCDAGDERSRDFKFVDLRQLTRLARDRSNEAPST